MTDHDRLPRAFRQAIEALPASGELDPGAARARARARRTARAAVGLATTVVLIVAVALALPRWGGSPSQVAKPGPAAPTSSSRATGGQTPEPVDQAPAGWRTEYYRDISFQVPSTWGYAYEPGSDWCSDSVDGRPAEQHRRPYVSLGRPELVRTVGCPEQPDSLLSEHVAVHPRPDPLASNARPSDSSSSRAGWTVTQRVLDRAVIVVTSRDDTLARRIADSAAEAGPGAPCPAANPMRDPVGARPVRGPGLASLPSVDRVAICQYGAHSLEKTTEPSLRAVRQLRGSAARSLLDTMTEAPTSTRGCSPQAAVPGDLAVLVVVQAADGEHQVYVQVQGCDDDSDAMDGGIDDGSTVRLLTRSACRALLVEPLTLMTATGQVGRNCVS